MPLPYAAEPDARQGSDHEKKRIPARAELRPGIPGGNSTRRGSETANSTEDEDVRRMSYDMATTQGHQAGQLYGWLAAWGLNQLGSQPPMAWMGHTGHGMGALMPGMATPEQIKELSAASGVDAERMFLRLMITHHQGALEMSNAVLERSQHPVVRAFATAVLTSQQAEIDLMTSMLNERNRRN